MCRLLSEGGARCASHTRPAYQNAPFGTPQWDEAAAAYASTPTGRMELLGSKAAAEEARDIASVVAFEHALAQGERMREKAEAFRDELAAYSAPAPVIEPAPAAVTVAEFEPEDDFYAEDYYDAYSGDDEDDDYGTDSGDFSTWSPTMAGQRWNSSDETFRGCTPAMTSDQFIDRVCENVGVSRSEFEAAAAEYLSRNSVPLVALSGTDTHHFGSTGSVGTLSAGQLRTLLTMQAAPRFTPEQVKEIALIAQRHREEQATAARAAQQNQEAQQAQQAPADQAAAETPARPARRSASWELPTVPDDPAELTRLADDADLKIRQAVAAHANTPAEVLERLSQSGQNAKVRAQAARNENLPLDRLTALASDRLSTVRAGAARNEAMPHEYLENLAEDANENVVGSVARNPSTHIDTYAVLARHDLPGVRKHAARRKDIPADIEMALAGDNDSQVRGALAKNRTTSIQALRRLCTDSEQSVRAAAAKNPNFPASMLRGRVARDSAPGVRAAAAGNRNTPVGTLTRLSADPDAWVRRNVAWNERTPAILLLALANDEDPLVRQAVTNRRTNRDTNHDEAA